jgi:hypothetical protein
MKKKLFKMLEDKITRIAFLSVIVASQSFAGLCADVNQSKFLIKSIKEYIWEDADISSLGAATEMNTLTNPENIKVIRANLNYEIPVSFELDCDWQASTIGVLKNTNSTTLFSDSKINYTKLRDVKAIDVDNDNNILVPGADDYWLHLVDNEADTVNDGFTILDNNQVSLKGSYFVTQSGGTFDIWWSAIYIDHATSPRLLSDSFITRRDSASAITGLKNVFASDSPFPEYKTQLQLLRLRFQQDHTSGITDNIHTIKSQMNISENIINWSDTQTQVKVYNLEGSLIESSDQKLNYLDLNHLQIGNYIIETTELPATMVTVQ